MADREKAYKTVMANLSAIYEAAVAAKNLQAAFDATCKMLEVACYLPTDPAPGLQPLYRSTPGEFLLMKADEDQRMVFGWANITKDAAGETIIDAHGDYIETEDLESAAYEHVLKFRATGSSHKGDVKGQMVESLMVTPEKLKALGLEKGSLPEGWWVGYKVDDDELWADVKRGKFRSFSVQGTGTEEQEVTDPDA